MTENIVTTAPRKSTHPRSDTGPFALLPMWVMDACLAEGPQAGATAITLYLALSRYADNGSGECWPSLDTLAEQCHVSADTIRRARKLLVAVGALEVTTRHREDGSQASNLYTVVRASRPSVHETLPPDQRQGPPPTTAGDPPRPAPGRELDLSELDLSNSALNGVEVTLFPLPEQERAENDNGFSVFWNAYPRKVGRARAEKRWNAMKVSERRSALAAIPAHCAYWTERNEPQFIPYPTTWLNECRWDDDVTVVASAAPARHQYGRDQQAQAEWMRGAL